MCDVCCVCVFAVYFCMAYACVCMCCAWYVSANVCLYVYMYLCFCVLKCVHVFTCGLLHTTVMFLQWCHGIQYTKTCWPVELVKEPFSSGVLGRAQYMAVHSSVSSLSNHLLGLEIY